MPKREPNRGCTTNLAVLENLVMSHAPSGTATAELTAYSSPDRVRAVALVLPGGKADSYEAAIPTQLTAVRMRPFARALARSGAEHGLAVSMLRYRYRGWNGIEASPTSDARWALDEVRRAHGDIPVVLVGHSMGGRTSLRVADDASVVGVVALAPWLSGQDPVAQLVGKRTLIAHGNLDFVTSPRASRSFAARAAAAGADVTYQVIHGDSHAMLLRPLRWHHLTTRTTLDFLDQA
ncbi:MAG TPA: alpha/beta fold hydrolase [Mycobacteriales bacterium]|nr:alpha/beta fold hydrolase [Mycobacteriales bacterium]